MQYSDASTLESLGRLRAIIDEAFGRSGCKPTPER